MRANAAVAFIACAELRLRVAVSTMLSRASSWEAIPTATLSPAVSNATPRNANRPAGDFLRWLYRERRLTDAELDARLRALDALASGKLPAPLATTANPCPRKSRPPLLPTNV